MYLRACPPDFHVQTMGYQCRATLTKAAATDGVKVDYVPDKQNDVTGQPSAQPIQTPQQLPVKEAELDDQGREDVAIPVSVHTGKPPWGPYLAILEGNLQRISTDDEFH
jgi:hypothetical protein